MTPAARDAAAISILDAWLQGKPVEQALTQWARASRFAGSGDRHAVRDIVFQAVRCARSAAARAGGSFDDLASAQVTGRQLRLGLAVETGTPPALWTGEGHAPEALSEAELALFNSPPDLSDPANADVPDWLHNAFSAALGDQTAPILSRMRERAPVFVRVNLQMTTRDEVIADLARDQIDSRPHALSPSALEVTKNPRRLRNSAALRDGRIEMQDAASQAVSDLFAQHAEPVLAEQGSKGRVLDCCAGGGGKSLALAAHGFRVSAHDIDPKRMRDIPLRAERAGVRIDVLQSAPKGKWPAILADAPCSGSGSWRRAPEAKWQITPQRLAELNAIQDDILARCAELCAPQGVIGYATCSLLPRENSERIAAFLAKNSDWQLIADRSLTPLDGGDGFYLAVLRRTRAK